jgi:hypothetical protein
MLMINLRFLYFILEYFFPGFGRIMLVALRHLGNILFFFSINHRSHRYKIVIGVGIGPVIAEAIVVH